MADNTPMKEIVRARRALKDRFNLLSDKASDEVIDRRIREGVELRGATPWILMFAILVASIGLNVNSTAVIIGAMLISPLMGPIMGIGHGVAIYDFELVRRSFFNLFISAAISLAVSALYFMLTPLAEAQSELLARTSPTLWDVLIALFGGFAGIIGFTREERSNVVPGVAIATALMPPLCTAGYGLATGQWGYFGGAFYLFSINCVFIALATIIGIRLVRFPVHRFVDKKTEGKVRLAMWIVALATALPSAYLASQLVRNEVYRSKASQFVKREFVFDDAYVANVSIDPKTRVIDVSLIGIPLNNATLRQIEGKLAVAGLPESKILVHQAGEHEKIDMTSLKSSLLSDLYKQSQEALQKKDVELSAVREELSARNRLIRQAADIAAEVRAQTSTDVVVILSEGLVISSDNSTAPVVQMIVQSEQALSENEQSKLVDWFKVRAKSEHVRVLFDVRKPEPATN